MSEQRNRCNPTGYLLKLHIYLEKKIFELEGKLSSRSEKKEIFLLGSLCSRRKQIKATAGNAREKEDPFCLWTL